MRVIIVALLLVWSTYAQASDAWKSERKTFRGLSYRVVTLDPKRVDLKLYWRRPDQTPFVSLKSLRESLQAGGRQFIMATNAGIYSRKYTPVGLHIERQKQLAPISRSRAPGGNFSMVPNGVFFLGPAGAQILETRDFLKASPVAQEASQSGPLLVDHGKLHPQFRENSPNAKLRNGVGVDQNGQAVFVISEGLVNFYDFALFFREQLHCASALYLDGTISKMIVAGDPGLAGSDEAGTGQIAPFVGMWAAVERP